MTENRILVVERDQFELFFFFGEEFVARLDWAFVVCESRSSSPPIIPVWNGRLISEFYSTIFSMYRVRMLYNTHTMAEALLTHDNEAQHSQAQNPEKVMYNKLQFLCFLCWYNYVPFGKLLDQFFFIYTWNFVFSFFLWMSVARVVCTQHGFLMFSFLLHHSARLLLAPPTRCSFCVLFSLTLGYMLTLPYLAYRGIYSHVGSEERAKQKRGEKNNSESKNWQRNTATRAT